MEYELTQLDEINETTDHRFLMPPRPHDYLVWSLVSVLFCNVFCLGFVALYYSLRCRDAYDSFDMNKAIYYSHKARSCNKTLLYVGSVLIGLYLVSAFLILVMNFYLFTENQTLNNKVYNQ